MELRMRARMGRALAQGSRIAERSAGHDARFGGYLMWGVKRQHYPLGTTRTELPRRRWRDRRVISDHGGTEVRPGIFGWQEVRP